MNSYSRASIQSFIHRLTPQINSRIQKGYLEPLELEKKEAHSPVVTRLDREIEQLIRERLAEDYPKDSILGEEFGYTKGNSKKTWIIDPIDGTIAFCTKKPLFGTLLALMDQDEFSFGMIHNPILEETYLGFQGEASTLQGQQIRTSAEESLELARLSTTTPDMFPDAYTKQVFQKLSKKCFITSFGGDCIQYGLLASGSLEIVMENQMNPHDFAALVPIVEGAGGVITDWNGQSLNLNSQGDVLACANQTIHAQVLELIQGVKDDLATSG